MISVIRNIGPALIESDADVVNERTRARDLFSPNRDAENDIDQLRNDFKFEVYRKKNLKIKELLSSSSASKCYYCESPLKHVAFGEIEHFRPKKKPQNLLGETYSNRGYYWLASNWENLNFSCVYCNRLSIQPFFKEGRVINRTVGKGSRFPLRGGSSFSTDSVNPENWISNKPEDQKDVLCLDPSDPNINPESYFEYSNEGYILPKKGIDSSMKLIAQTTIEIFALQRFELIKQRHRVLMELKLALKLISNHESNFNALVDEGRIPSFIARQLLKDEIENVFIFTLPSSPYSGMCRFWLKKYFKESGILNSEQEYDQIEINSHKKLKLRVFSRNMYPRVPIE